MRTSNEMVLLAVRTRLNVCPALGRFIVTRFNIVHKLGNKKEIGTKEREKKYKTPNQASSYPIATILQFSQNSDCLPSEIP